MARPLSSGQRLPLTSYVPGLLCVALGGVTLPATGAVRRPLGTARDPIEPPCGRSSRVGDPPDGTRYASRREGSVRTDERVIANPYRMVLIPGSRRPVTSPTRLLPEMHVYEEFL